jgi:hypothetical protein
MRNVPGLAVLVLLAGCSSPPPPSLATPCPDIRPQVCTMEYAPVCARLVAGGTRQYSSGCNACADDAVASHVAGPCPE